MSVVGLLQDPVFELHETGPAHPERPARLRAIQAALESRDLSSRCALVPPEEASDDALGAVHDPAYVRHVHQVCAFGPSLLDAGDTPVCRESFRVARIAAGSVAALCRRVVRGELRRGFAAVRPPGHHAEGDRAMGFCLFNNVAVAAEALRREAGIQRILIVDWDVHHGNGTQHHFESDPGVFYFSVHQFPLYPGTGAEDERGIGPGLGATLNRPLSPGAGDGEFLNVLGSDLAAAAADFLPEFVLVSAGFDAHAADPLASLQVSTRGFSEATRIVRGIADRHAGGRLVSVLEGGYDLQALGESVAAHVEALL